VTRAAAFVVGLVAFLVLATANSGGYRYGISDQAYYVPAIMHAADPTLFPRDAVLLDAQSRHMLVDDVQGTVARSTGLDFPALAFGFYVLTILALYAGAFVFARASRFSGWATTAFVLLLTFRHRIAKTGANSLEGYAHPRMFAFALGLAALGALVGRRIGWAVGLVVGAGLIHPTTGCWFGIVVVAAVYVDRPAWRRAILAAAALAASAGLWAVTLGPLADRLAPMDDAWLAVLADKDYLFPAGWPLYAWVLNLLYPVVIVAVYRARVRAGVAAPGEAGLMAGVGVLTLVFLISVPLTMLHTALAVQLQVNRVFWVLDVLAAASLAWWLTRSGRARPRLGPALAVGILAAASVGRGVFLLVDPEPDRPLVRVQLPDSAWVDVLSWIERQPEAWQVLADPDHAWKYGVSVRLGARRDTVLEIGKDSALAMYDRAIAMRVAVRAADLAGFDTMDPTRAMTLASRYDATVLVVERLRALPLPVLYANDAFVVHDLRH